MTFREVVMTERDIEIIKQALHTSHIKFLKRVLLAIGVALLLLFAPLFFMKPFKQNISGILVHDAGWLYALLWVGIPLLLFVCCCYISGPRKFKKDLYTRIKLVGIVGVKHIKELTTEDKQHFKGEVDHVIAINKNTLGLREVFFDKAANPEMFHVKAYRVEVSKFAKVTLKSMAISHL